MSAERGSGPQAQDKRAYAVVEQLNNSDYVELNFCRMTENNALAAAGFAPGEQVEIRPREEPRELFACRICGAVWGPLDANEDRQLIRAGSTKPLCEKPCVSLASFTNLASEKPAEIRPRVAPGEESGELPQEAPRAADEWPTTHADKEAAAFRALNAAAPEVPSALPHEPMEPLFERTHAESLRLGMAETAPPSALPSLVTCAYRADPHPSNSHGWDGPAECKAPRPALPEEVVCDSDPLPHSLAEDDETPCANPRPAHPPAARVEREICKEDGCPLATDADLKRALGPADKEWADSLCWVNVGCRHRDPKPVSAAPVADGGSAVKTLCELLDSEGAKVDLDMLRDTTIGCGPHCAAWTAANMGRVWLLPESASLCRAHSGARTVAMLAMREPVSAAPVVQCVHGGLPPHNYNEWGACAAPVELAPKMAQHDPPGSCVVTSSGICTNHPNPAPRVEPEKLGKESEIARLGKERSEWQESAEAYCDHAGRRFKLLKRIHAACGRAISGDQDKKSMLATLQFCASLAADETQPAAVSTKKET